MAVISRYIPDGSTSAVRWDGDFDAYVGNQHIAHIVDLQRIYHQYSMHHPTHDRPRFEIHMTSGRLRNRGAKSSLWLAQYVVEEIWRSRHSEHPARWQRRLNDQNLPAFASG
ncbi:MULTISPECIES: hypothetical protein [Rhizobium]|uniref:hypothetical protein n=1 Tax=Rhizobium TaxID=379 RepID=UPI000462C77F|nr:MULTISPECIES: hypothetical protein [Rhizobium]UFS81544.1 hypothetical protein LPB79_25060 [Rhizobium sp. T136]